jgi:hypothetical protein
MKELSFPSAKASLVENASDLFLCVLIQQAVDFGDDSGRSLFGFPGIEWTRQS